MANNVLKLLLKSMWHRKRQTVKISLTALFAAFFIMIFLLFQENIYQWQIASNLSDFGSWFIMESRNEPSDKLVSDDRLAAPSKASYYVKMYNKNWKKTNIYLGTMTEEFIKQANIKLDKGRMPVGEDEIACDWNTLEKLGYSGKLGQEIKIKYYLDDNKSKIMPEREKTFTLVGVFSDYTEIWSIGKFLPGGVISEEAADNIDGKAVNIWIYDLKDGMSKAGEYEQLFTEIDNNVSGKQYYNEGVYNFNPWGPENIYNYIFFIISFIGIMALIYQLIGYLYQRLDYYRKLRFLGVTKNVIYLLCIFEIVLIMVVSCSFGTALALIAGRVAGNLLSGIKGIAFYRVTSAIIAKQIISLFVGVFIVIGLCFIILRGLSDTYSVEKKSKKEESEFNNKNVLNEKNYKKELYKRTIKSNGKIQNIGVKIFSFAVFLLIVFCCFNIFLAVKMYNKYENMSDLSGFVQDIDVNNPYTFDISYVKDSNYKKSGNTNDQYAYLFSHRIEERITKEKYVNFFLNNNIKYFLGRINISEKIDENTENNYFLLESSNIFNKGGNSNLISGISDNFIYNINELKGVKNISYSAFDTSRTWRWDDMDYDNSMVKKWCESGNAVSSTVFRDRYIFASEYVTPTKDIFERLSAHCDNENLSYDKFLKGEDVFVFINKDMYEHYDETIKQNTLLEFGYYSAPYNDSVYYNKLNDEEKPFPYWEKFYKNIETVLYDKNEYNYNEKTEFAKSSEYYEACYDLIYGSCATVNVAGVILVDEEIKEEFKDLIPDFGYYTSIASDSLARKLIDNQNELFARLLNTTVDELPDEVRCELNYNQINVSYTMDAAFSATNNILSSYCKSFDIVFSNCSEIKETKRTEALNAILEYGFTIIAAIIVHILIYLILIKNRLANRTERFRLLKRLGADIVIIRNITQKEIISDCIWCIFTLPVLYLIGALMTVNYIKKL